MSIEYHQYANLFPFIEGASFEQFVEDVRKHGVLEPVVFLDGKILDGRNRYKAAERLGVEYPKTNYEGSDPLGFVLSHNLNRRHLTESQRAMVAAKLASMDEGRPSNTAPIGAVSQTDAAALLNVGRRSVQRAKEVQQLGSPELIAAVAAGKVSVSAAAEVAGLPQDQQATVIAAGPTAIKEAAKESRQLRGKKPDPKIDALQAEALDGHSQELKDHIAARNAVVASRSVSASNDDHADRIEELEAINEELTAKNAELQAKVDALEPMRLEYERGGFAEVIKRLESQLKSRDALFFLESKKAADHAASAKHWRKVAIAHGYSRDEVIDLGAVNG